MMGETEFNAYDENGNRPLADNETEGLLRRFATWLVKYWWAVPLCIVLQAALFLLVIFQFPGGWMESLVSIIFLVIIIIELIKFVILFVKKKWGKLAASVFLDLLLACTAGPMMVLFTMSAPDGFARHHKIPDGVTCHEPIKDASLFGLPDEKPDKVPVIDSTDKNSYLQISGEQGSYWYDFYYPALRAGTVFLKCYEVGKNEPLSMDRLPEKSAESHPATTFFSQIVHKKDFTLYEGDWGEYYAVRVEVWHRDKASRKETKLLEKIYRMDGWQR